MTTPGSRSRRQDEEDWAILIAVAARQAGVCPDCLAALEKTWGTPPLPEQVGMAEPTAPT
jgi:hypothetical protein